MAVSLSVALLGFGPFERSALASAFHMSTLRGAGYRLVDRLQDSRFAVVDADGPDALAVLDGAFRIEDVVYVGSQAPTGAHSWLMRPLDAARVLLELDLMAARSPGYTAEDPDPVTTITGWLTPPRRVLCTQALPLPSRALGRRLGDGLGAATGIGRAYRRS